MDAGELNGFSYKRKFLELTTKHPHKFCLVQLNIPDLAHLPQLPLRDVLVEGASCIVQFGECCITRDVVQLCTLHH